METQDSNVSISFPSRRGGGAKQQRITFDGPPCLSPSALLSLEGLVDGGRFFDRNIQRSGGKQVVLIEYVSTHIQGKFSLRNTKHSVNNSAGRLEVRLAGVETRGDVSLEFGSSGRSDQVVVLEGDFKGDIDLDFSGEHTEQALRLRITPDAVLIHSVAGDEERISDGVQAGDVDISEQYEIDRKESSVGNLSIVVRAKARVPHRAVPGSRH